MPAPLALLALAAVPVLPALPNGESGKISPSQVTPGARFGAAIAAEGGLAVFGAPDDGAVGQKSGSAHVVDLGTGQTLGKLVPGDGAEFDGFGHSVAIDGTTVLVGAPFHDEAGALSGAAYLFDVEIGAELVELVASDGWLADQFGFSVALGGGRALVGAPFDDDFGGISGSVYVFDAATGEELVKLHASDAGPAQYFGHALAVDGSLALVGAPRQSFGSTAGAAYLFDLTTGQELLRLEAADGGPGQLFGWSVALEGGLAVVGAIGDADNGEYSGAAYVFDVATGQQLAKLRPIDSDPGDHVGMSIDVAGGVVLLGAAWDDERGKDSGSAYLFDTAGALLAKLIAVDSANLSAAGTSVALDGGTAIVGAPGTLPSGAAYLFDVAPEVSVGTNYCGPAAVNSTGLPGRIEAFGSLVVADNCVRLVAVDLPQDEFTLFLNSMQVGSSVPPGSQGTLCLGGSIGRYKKQIAHTGLDGAASVSLDLPFTPNGAGTVAIQPGETWRFQAWFRDANPDQTSNLTDGIALTFS